MLHWRLKFWMVAVVALTIAAALGRAEPIGFFW